MIRIKVPLSAHHRIRTLRGSYLCIKLTEKFNNIRRLRIFPDLFYFAPIIALTCWAVLYFWRLSAIAKIEIPFDFQPQTSKPIGQKQMKEILKLIPRVTELHCDDFLIPPQKWNATEELLSEMVPKTEHTPRHYEDCQAITMGWADIPVSNFERNNPIAFSIMIYNSQDRFARLLRAIYRTSNVYCVHIDQKSTIEFKRVASQIASCFDNVFITRHSIPVHWGTRSVLDQEIICLKELWEQKVKWRWVINLTGEEFPLKTNLELVHILNTQKEFNDVWVDPCTEDAFNSDWPACLSSTTAKFRERWADTGIPPLYVQPYKGQVHVVLSRAMVDYVLHNENAKAIYNWSLTTTVSDEIFFSTLNANAHLKAPGSNAVTLVHPIRIRPSFARLKLWKIYREMWPYCRFYLRGICLLSLRELSILTNSWQMFANKFKPHYQPMGYACLEEWYFNRVVRELQTGRVQLDLRVYHNLYYMKIGL